MRAKPPPSRPLPSASPSELPTPRLAAIVGEQPGVAVLHVRRAPGDGNPHSAVVHWVSLGTGTFGTASFPTLDSQPVTIRPGSGQVIAYVDPQTIGTPGFGTFFVPLHGEHYRVALLP